MNFLKKISSVVSEHEERITKEALSKAHILGALGGSALAVPLVATGYGYDKLGDATGMDFFKDHKVGLTAGTALLGAGYGFNKIRQKATIKDDDKLPWTNA